VLRARLSLESRPRAGIAERLRVHAEKRRGQPLAMPNVGCIFKNPAGESAGRLIDRAGLKGERAGRIEVSRVHANFMVNVGGGTAADVRELIRRVRDRVRESSGILLEPEVVVLDETGRPSPLDAGVPC
jgi:UDP-N-acetylmuramate dehydrogenase